MAKTVNYGTPYNHRLSLRLNDKQYEFVLECSRLLGVSPSDYIRMSINSGMVVLEDVQKKKLEEEAKKKEEEAGTHNENVKANHNNFI